MGKRYSKLDRLLEGKPVIRGGVIYTMNNEGKIETFKYDKDGKKLYFDFNIKRGEFTYKFDSLRR